MTVFYAYSNIGSLTKFFNYYLSVKLVVNSVTNIYRIAKNAINGLERPKYLCRKMMIK